MRIKCRKIVFYLLVLSLVSTVTLKYFGTRIKHERQTYQQPLNTSGVERYIDHGVTEKSDYLNDVAERNYYRRKTVREKCAILNETANKQRNLGSNKDDGSFIRAITDQRSQVIYCRINKAASTFTTMTLGRLLGYYPKELRYLSENFRRLPSEERKVIFDRDYTFMFVREPYGRLFSTYCNKFYFPKGNWAPLGPQIVWRYRKDRSKDSLHFGHDVTFAEMIRFTVENFESGSKMDAHIRPMHVECKPCVHEYDFIGKLETMVSDWKYLTHQLKTNGVIPEIPPQAGEKESINLKTFSEMKHFQSTLDMVKGSSIDSFSLYKRAWRYYQITSVISKHIEMPFKRTDFTNISYDSFLQEMEKAATLSKTYKSDLKLQKFESMMHAYSTVPLELMERLRNVVLVDCLLYDYEDRPKWLFDRELQNSTSNMFNYFSDLS